MWPSPFVGGQSFRRALQVKPGVSRTKMKSIRIKSHEEFEKLLTSIASDTVTATIHWRLHQELWAAKADWTREMAQSWTFWSLTIIAHYEVALVRLGRLYDEHEGALSLARLLATIEDNLEVFDEPAFRERLKGNPFVDSLASTARRPDGAILSDDRRLVVGSDPLVAKLVAARDKAVAHRDPRVVLGTLPNPSLALASSDLQELLDRAGQIANRYTHLFRASVYSMNMVGADDFKTVLGYVRTGLARHEDLIQEELARLSKGGAG